MNRFNVAIVGATGLVGEKMREILEERNFPVNSLRLFSSERSKGVTLPFRGEKIPMEVLPPVGATQIGSPFQDVEIVLFSAGKELSLEWSPKIVGAGLKPAPIVIDNSSAFRMDPDVPLVVPEVNPEALRKFSRIGVSPVPHIIANPNCSTIQMVVALYPLHKIARIKRIVVSTYQSVSGFGRDAVETLQRESNSNFQAPKSKQIPNSKSEILNAKSQILNLKSALPSPFPHPIAFNLIPQIDEFNDKGDTYEEEKMVNETRKILGEPDLKITATCVRVPVYVGHSETVNVEFENKITPEEAREVLSRAPGVQVIDEPLKSKYPLPVDAEGKDDVFVGRIRKDPSVEFGLNLWIVSDNLRKGAATNAIQIAELLFSGD